MIITLVTLIFMLPAVLVLVVPLISMIVEMYIKFVTRGRKDPQWASNTIRRMADTLYKEKHTDYQWRWSDGGMYYVLVAGIFLGIVGFGLSVLANNGNLDIALISILTVFILTLPRYFMDVVNTLKYCFRTKESVRLSDLDKKVAELERKLKETSK